MILMGIDDTSHELACHHCRVTFVLQHLALWSLRMLHLVGHGWDLHHLLIGLTWNQRIVYITVNLHLWLIGRFMNLVTLLCLLLMGRIPLYLWHLRNNFLLRHVETPLGCFVRISYVFTVEMAVWIELEKTSSLIHRKVDVSIVEKTINDTRISNDTSINYILIALARNLMRLWAIYTVILRLNCQVVIIILSNVLPLLHVRKSWNN